ncbi:MAG: DNA polymerase III subunit alpha [Chitinispirillaceae bacterium]|nr:DNA polymerase III subunit alpha [Chitinispirillaceae bacterium]
MVPLLQVISSFSLLRGVLSPEKICRLARDAGYRALCITDRDNLYGLPVFLESCRSCGLKAIVGAELTGEGGPVLLYADGGEGYANLCNIISKRHAGGEFDLRRTVEAHRQGIRVAGDSSDTVLRLGNSGPAYYRLERPRRPPAWVGASSTPCLITPPIAFSQPADFRTHRLLRAIGGNTTLSRINGDDLLPEKALFVKPDELAGRYELFGEAMRTTAEFAEAIRPPPAPAGAVMPRFTSGGSSEALLREKTLAGAVQRYGAITGSIGRRIDYELDTIIKKGFADYFLIVEDIVRQSPRTCGRGSAAASIVAYCLGITNVDPVRYNLMFERFLNPGRSDPPDIDIDFAWDERDGVLEYVFKRFGGEHTAMVATHQRCGARMAIRETARLYGLTEHEIGVVTKKIPWLVDLQEYADNLEEVVRQWPSFHGVSFDPPWPEIFRDAGRIVGLPRGIGTHCGGVLVTPGPIRSTAPVQHSAKGYPIVQWEKEGVEAMGLVKIDLLGNRSLAVIRDAIASIKREGVPFDERRWDPQSDPATRTLLAEGRTMGVFYVESPAMRLLQRKSRRGDFDHMVIHSSIIRPAANKYIREYLRRLHGASWRPLHPLLEETLAETFGIMVYQEDVSRVAMALAGFTAEEADKLRKIVAKKSGSATFDDCREQFFSGASANGVSASAIRRVWEMMESFRGYSFCKPHSASYVQVSFQSAWLKAHHPAHFMAAVLSNYGGFYTTQAYVGEAMRLGLTIVPPNVNRSAVAWGASGSTLFVGLCQIKGLSHKGRDAVVAAREEGGPFRSIEALLARTGIEEADAEKLLLAGAADFLPQKLNRPQQFWTMRVFYRSRRGGEAPTLQPITPRHSLQYQYRTLGFLTACHPIMLVNPARKRPAFRADRIDCSVGKRVALFGWCVTSKTVTAVTGDSMEFVTFEDETGTFETVFFPHVYRHYSALLARQTAFLIEGRVTAEFNVAVIEVTAIGRV